MVNHYRSPLTPVHWQWLLDLDHLVRYCLGQISHPPRRIPDLEERLRHG